MTEALTSPKTGIHLFPSFLPQALAAFSGREFDASKNLGGFLTALGLSSPERFFTVNQVHGDRVVLASSRSAQEIVDGDAVVTGERNLALVIRTADCLPVFLLDPQRRAAGLVHVGWRGAHKGILRRAVNLLAERFGSQPSSLCAGLGPAICKACYEVGREFHNYFPGWVRSEGEDRFFFDLPGCVKGELAKLRVPEDSVVDSGICTACSVDRFFSARREGSRTGRFISVVMLK